MKQRIFKFSMFFLILIILTILSLIPTSNLKTPGLNDKILHFGAYVFLCFCADFLLKKNILFSAMVLFVYGIMIEIIQYFLPYREFEFLDMVANSAGIAVYLIIKLIYSKAGRVKEPNWNVLFNFGLPINIENNKVKKYNYDRIEKEIILAAKFLLENRYDEKYLRNFDAFKAMLLALKIHYPSRYHQLGNLYKINFEKSFELSDIQGKHIKLRNISLGDISKYFKS